MEPIAHFTVWGQIKIDILMLPQNGEMRAGLKIIITPKVK